MNNQNRKSKQPYCSNSPKINQDHFLSDQNINVFRYDSSDNAETLLIRTLIGIIYEHELEIVHHLRTFYSESEIEKNFSDG